MEEPTDYFNRLFEDLGEKPTTEQINKYNSLVLSGISSRYIAFGPRDSIVAHGNVETRVKDHSIAKGVFSPMILSRSFAITRSQEMFSEPLKTYPNTKVEN